MNNNALFDKFDEEKKEQISTLLDQPVLARLATAHPESLQPHVVPLWYLWDGQAVWISGFGSTRKFKELSLNPKCAILIEPADPNVSKLQAILFEGKSEIIQDDRALIIDISHQIYHRYLGEEGTKETEPQSWIHDPENLVARLRPAKAFAW